MFARATPLVQHEKDTATQQVADRSQQHIALTRDLQGVSAGNKLVVMLTRMTGTRRDTSKA